jgi:hypothetical protein
MNNISGKRTSEGYCKKVSDVGIVNSIAAKRT